MRPARPFVAHPRHPLTGKQVRISARTDRELQAALHAIDQLRTDYANGWKSAADIDRAMRRHVHGAVTLTRIARSYVAAGAARNTVRRVESFLRSAGAELATLDFADLDGPAVNLWVKRLAAKGYRGSTIATAWRTLSALARHAAERGWIAAAPWGAYRPEERSMRAAPRLREASRTIEELEQLFAAAAALDAEHENNEGRCTMVFAKIATMAMLGVRQGELGGLRWPDLDAARGTVTIERQYDGRPLKHSRPTRIAADGFLFIVLQEHADRLGRFGLYRSDGPVFPSPKHSSQTVIRPHRSGEVLTRVDLRTAVQKAGLPNVRAWAPTSLRDSFATLEQRAADGDLRRLSERTRHASIASLARYLRARTREPAPPGFSPRLESSRPTPLLTDKNTRR